MVRKFDELDNTNGGCDDVSSVIEIRGNGTVVQRKIRLLPNGGVQILKGRCGSGKSTTINACRTAVGADIPLNRNDDCDEASVSFGGSTVRLAKKQTRSGVKACDLEVVHVEDQYDISQLVNPGLKSDEANDAVRIKALVQLSGVKVDFGEYAKLIPQGETVSIEEARNIADTVAQASKVKRIFDAEALRIERLADEAEENERACLEAISGIDLAQKCDEHALQQDHTEAVSLHAKLKQQKDAADKAAKARDEAKAQLAAAGKSYDGPEVAAAQIGLDIARKDEESANVQLEAARRALREAEHLVERVRVTTELRQKELEAAQNHDRLLRQWTRSLETDLPQPPMDEDLEAAAAGVEETAKAVQAGAIVRRALEKKHDADKYHATAVRYRARAEQLRDAASGAEGLLSKAVKFPSLFVKGGRLIYKHEDGHEEFFSRRSDGQRWHLAIQIGAQRVSEKTGNGTRLLILPQEAWQSLDPDLKDVVNDAAIAESITILTAEVARGELRCVRYGAEDVELVPA